MKLTQTLRVAILVCLSFAAYCFLFINIKPIKEGLDSITRNGLLSYTLAYLVVGIPIFVGTFAIDRKTSIFKSLGLSSNAWVAMWVSVLFTLPMFVGSLLFFKFNGQVDAKNLVAGTIIAGFMEELYFRGFLFGQLFRKTSLGFIPSVLLGALLFAFGHLYQSQSVGELVGIFAITFSGAVFFAWLYTEWNYNLWVPIFMHTLMNLSWIIFSVDNTALGDVTANVFRGLTIAAAILLTILYKRRKNQKMAVNRLTLMRFRAKA